jgi:hypothetical protein
MNCLAAYLRLRRASGIRAIAIVVMGVVWAGFTAAPGAADVRPAHPLAFAPGLTNSPDDSSIDAGPACSFDNQFDEDDDADGPLAGHAVVAADLHDFSWREAGAPAKRTSLHQACESGLAHSRRGPPRA